MAVHAFLDTLRPDGFVFYQALQVVEGNSLHAEAVPQQCEAEGPNTETILAGKHLIWYGILALDAFQEALELRSAICKEKWNINVDTDVWVKNS